MAGATIVPRMSISTVLSLPLVSTVLVATSIVVGYCGIWIIVLAFQVTVYRVVSNKDILRGRVIFDGNVAAYSIT